MNMGKDLTEVRSPQRQLAPDIVGLEQGEPTFLQGIANKAKTNKHDGLVLRDSEYDRGTGCGKTARPGLGRGRRVTGAPTARRCYRMQGGRVFTACGCGGQGARTPEAGTAVPVYQPAGGVRAAAGAHARMAIYVTSSRRLTGTGRRM